MAPPKATLNPSRSGISVPRIIAGTARNIPVISPEAILRPTWPDNSCVPAYSAGKANFTTPQASSEANLNPWGPGRSLLAPADDAKGAEYAPLASLSIKSNLHPPRSSLIPLPADLSDVGPVSTPIISLRTGSSAGEENLADTIVQVVIAFRNASPEVRGKIRDLLGIGGSEVREMPPDSAPQGPVARGSERSKRKQSFGDTVVSKKAQVQRNFPGENIEADDYAEPFLGSSRAPSIDLITGRHNT